MTGVEAVVAMDSGQALEFGAGKYSSASSDNPTHTSSRQSAKVFGTEWRTLQGLRVRIWRE